jgi:hypothetical protein
LDSVMFWMGGDTTVYRSVPGKELLRWLRRCARRHGKPAPRERLTRVRRGCASRSRSPASWTRQASSRYWKHITKSSMYLIIWAAPRNRGFYHANQRPSTCRHTLLSITLIEPPWSSLFVWIDFSTKRTDISIVRRAQVSQPIATGAQSPWARLTVESSPPHLA